MRTISFFTAFFCWALGFVMYNWWLIKWLSEYRCRKEYKGLPRGCWHCELLGICRRPKEKGWRSYGGCLIKKSKVGKQ